MMRKISLIRSGDKKKYSQAELIYAITLGAAVLLLIAVIKDSFKKPAYINDSNGNAVGIICENKSESSEYKFRLKVKGANSTEERNITIRKYPKQNNKDSHSEESSVDAELSGIITDIELSDKDRIMLPLKLSDGSVLMWKARSDNNDAVMGIIVGYLIIIAAVIIEKYRKPISESEILRKRVNEGLPRFVNQLIMLMNSGMILSDSIKMISDSYRIIPIEDRTTFEQMIIDTDDKYSKDRMSQASRIFELARETNVKELIRIAAILSENEKRGSDIAGNLERESSFLWEDRKIVAKERGKIIDTKMSYPLAILLLMLIVITMAPAMMSM